MSLINDCAVCFLLIKNRHLKAGHDVILSDGGTISHDFHKSRITQGFCVKMDARERPSCSICREPATKFYSIDDFAEKEARKIDFLTQVETDEALLQEIKDFPCWARSEPREVCVCPVQIPLALAMGRFK
jgi:hypothetical protein